ncbi:hypothetical protein NDU88_003384 [Pleurodeles waltl]|uniref:Uncharacterized protein n=1 Tax=Pleurodeles waltl TaxID=8319 RepID=A0AAV7UCD8_PLEWA|nr:hypothetical protein NDU88_003384 [Pleurodeles waltl]
MTTDQAARPKRQKSRAQQWYNPPTDQHRRASRAPQLAPRMAPPGSPGPNPAGAAPRSGPVVEPFTSTRQDGQPIRPATPQQGPPSSTGHRRAVSASASAVRPRKRAAGSPASQHPPQGGRTATGRDRPPIHTGPPTPPEPRADQPQPRKLQRPQCTGVAGNRGPIRPPIRTPRETPHLQQAAGPQQATPSTSPGRPAWPGKPAAARPQPSSPAQARPFTSPRMFARRRSGPYLPPQRPAALTPLQFRPAGKA